MTIQRYRLTNNHKPTTNNYLFSYLCNMNNDLFNNLRDKLSKENNWPQVYMFKFIIPADNKKMALVESKFSDEANISQKESSNGKYMSITVKEVMLNADAVIQKYKDVSEIEGVMAL